MNYIYVITSIDIGYKYINKKPSPDGLYHSYLKRTSKNQKKYLTIRNQRAWGYFFDLKIAKKCVEENWGNLFEFRYNYVVIERIKEGLLTVPHKEWWYKWVYSNRKTHKGKFIPAKKPSEYTNIVGFGLG